MRNVVKPCRRLCQVSYFLQITQKVSLKTKKVTKTPSRNVASVEILHTPITKEDKCILKDDVEPKYDRFEPYWQETNVKWANVHSLYLKLAKIRLTALVTVTTVAGYTLAPASVDLCTLLCCSLGTGLVSSAANAINQYHEVPFDAQMARTKNRVLVRALLTPLHALSFAAVTSITGLSVLYLGCNGLTAALGATNLLLYTSIYTPLKRMSILNTWIGAIVGAIPPMMGWAACTGSLEPGAWILAGLLYAWQFPHFNALSWNLRPDYSRAGYRMMSVTNPDLCRRTTLRYTAVIAALSFAAPFYGVTNYHFLLHSLPLNTWFLYLAWKFYKESDSANSRRLFRYSLIHLPLLMAIMLIDKKQWFISKNDRKNSQINSTKSTDNVIKSGIFPESVAAILKVIPSL